MSIHQKTQSYFDIRTEVIWGNRYIKHNGKCLIFENWINSNIIFINDLLSNTGLVKETHIISKLENKSNWIAELNKLKLSIPKDWTLTLQSTESFNSTVKTDQQGTFVKNKNIYNLNNKQQKQIFTKHKCTQPYVHDYWTRVFKERIMWKSVYDFINNVIQNTKVRQMKYKLIHKIIPTNENLLLGK